MAVCAGRQPARHVRDLLLARAGELGRHADGGCRREAHQRVGDLLGGHRLAQHRGDQCHGTVAQHLCCEFVELGGSQDGPRDFAVTDEFLLCELGLVVAQADTVYANDRQQDVMSYPLPLPGP